MAPYEGHDDPVGTSSSGTTRAVDVIGVIGGGVEVEDQRDRVDVDPPGSNIGGDEHVESARSESRKGPFTLALAAIAMDGRRAKAEPAESIREPSRSSLGPAKDDGRPVRSDRFGGNGDPIVRFDVPEVVVHRSPIGVGGLHLVAHRVVLVVTDQLVDGSIEGRRKEQHLPRLAGFGDEATDVRQESHVGHPVGLVDNHHLHERQVDRAALDQIGESPRAGDQHVDALSQGGNLLSVTDAAVDRRHPGREDLSEWSEVCLDLGGEFPGGGDDQSERVPTTGSDPRLGLESRQDCQSKRERLARSGRCLAADVAPGKGVRKRRGLDWEGGGDAPLFQGRGQRPRQAKVAEAHRGAGTR